MDSARPDAGIEAAAHPLSERVAELERSYGDSVSIAEIADVVNQLMQSIEGDISAADLRLHRELHDLVRFIREARAEIARIRPERIQAEDIPRATDELDAVVRATEEATHTFLETAEELELMAGEETPERAERLRALATRIFEASNFQDVTGQRINKVVATLRSIEARVLRLAGLAGAVGGSDAPAAEERTGEAALLNGPALPAAANSQDDIDAILASFD